MSIRNRMRLVAIIVAAFAVMYCNHYYGRR
jgi:hypothetical protein